ncbi:GNAT family N-acetyltransferase [Roseobacter sp. HKCCD9010]|nr:MULTISPECIES: GNAT family N-acetyltransferase [unclassified Roseobacter]MBF9049588.1 GNAT family N-acetyltransferase [Rhodobacterales bacterium HKCCD4356]NNV38012.1 GNAT family N-acetyltransferase [Roseobacter sp. HKCCD9054]NNV46223.1 GNAT family N-acetyltransferase [Roseobacter sp. HKCCD6265]NNV75271.1 GNAT family N-acetyltransferase [Roseobacter sp. HKCCD6135]NNV84844.1 GNAT family N-acetyltransferase [Roseobacter sp. HKCCD8414]NNW35941.1 GNAT family N-acetyltransferase [Roseobacter sp. 
MTTEAISIRRAEIGDVPACAAVANWWIDDTDWLPRDYPPEAIEGMIRDALPTREIWVAGDPVEAYLSYDPEKKRVGALFCRHGGRGVGKALMDRVKEGQDYLWLTTHEPNLRAQKFYIREGFTEVERFIPEPPETVREVKMEWRAND